jgi:4-hydroxy-tetrahydrodipicolinate synthase
MNRKDKKYGGVIVPMVTPINADLSIDGASVASIMKTFTLNDVSVFILGTTGESVSVPDKQKTELVKLTIKERKNNTKVYAGISGNCLEESIESAKIYASLGVDAVVAHLPFYYPVSADSMLRYFEAVANKIDCNLILYNNPITVKWSIPLEVIDKLSHHENIAGVKDSERGMERLTKSLELWSNRNDFSFLLGWAAQSAFAAGNGCDGIVPSTGNLIPDIYNKLFRAASENRISEAERLQKITDEVSEIYQKDRTISESIPALKVLMSEYGLCKTYVFPPLYESCSEDQQKLRIAIKEKMISISQLSK